MSVDVTWDREKAVRLRRAYINARRQGLGEFTFDTGPTGEHVFLVDYAMYLLQYLSERLGEDLYVDRNTTK